MTAVPLDDSDVQRVLCVAAHPDDLDFGASGTVATWTRAGIAVTYLLCTRGDQGGFDDTPRELMPALREQEQRDAAAAVGVDDVRFLEGFRDGWLAPTHELQREIVRVGDPSTEIRIGVVLLRCIAREREDRRADVLEPRLGTEAVAPDDVGHAGEQLGKLRCAEV